MIVHAKPNIAQTKTASPATEEALGEAPPRHSSRAFVRLPARVTDGSSQREFVAFVRDISPTGAFFYADFNPQYGQHITTVATAQTPKGINTPGETSAYLRNPKSDSAQGSFNLCGSCLRKQRSLMQH
jgi:hypothetical protein